jgi:hypothetical protein
VTGTRILLVSPIPSHPQDQGNSARIHSLGRALQSAGFIVHFLYYQMEGLSAAQRAAMDAFWDDFHAVPSQPRAAAGPDGNYRLDDWWDPAVAEAALALHKRWRFRAVVANYVWFSAALDAFGDDVLKVLDTHDVFGGRADRFSAAGLAPRWFSTTPEEEARGLARADIVLAIQHEEAAYFRGLGLPDVRVVGHLMPQRGRPPRLLHPSGLVAGYLASGNIINLASFEKLRGCLAGDAGPRRLVVAGSICGALPSDAGPFEVMGRLDHTDEFYDGVDLVVNPMTFGTGLKIKSVEALSQGMPLLATATAMTGLPAQHPYHRFASVEDLASCLKRIEAGELAGLAAAARACSAEYAATVRAGFRDLVGSLRQ